MYAAILVYRNVNKLVASFAWNMVLCLIVSCGSKSGRDKGLYFIRVPSVVTNQGEEAQKNIGGKKIALDFSDKP